MSGSPSLVPLIEKYVESDPQSVARSLEAMGDGEASAVVDALPPRLAARIFPHLQVSYAAMLLEHADAETFKGITRALDPTRAATVFMHLHRDVQERLAPELPKKLKQHVQELLKYPEDSVGRIMLTKFLSFRKELKVREVIKKIRLLAQSHLPASYGYVVDEENRLVGVINMHDLLVAPSDAPLESVCRKEVFSLHCFTDREEAANELSRRKYFAVPVVDGEGRILGIVKAEQLLHGIQQEVTEDIQKMVGAGGDERAFSPIGFSLRKRLPWLHVNLATAFLAAGVVALFEGVIAQLTMLAVFLPVVAGQGGNAGAQSLAIVMRGLVMREIPRKKVWVLVLKETLLGAIHGVVIGVVTGLVAWLWYRNPILGVVVALGMLVNLISAGLSGAGIPILMKKLGLDPAQCSSIVLTTVTDVVGFFAFLGFAVLFFDLLK